MALVVACALFMESLDATVLTTALPTMARDFHTAAPDLSIALTAYFLALAIFIPASGAMADRHGAKRVFGLAVAVFMAGSIGCGLAWSAPSLVVARFVQGIGGAMMLPVGRLILVRSVARKDMVSAMAWMTVPGLLGPVIGPPFGGLLVTYVDWRCIFWINVPVGLVSLVLAARYFDDAHEPEFRPFDLGGFLLSAIALGCLLFGSELVSHPAQRHEAVTLILTGLVAGALYLAHARRAAHPIFDLSLLGVPTFRLSMIAGSLTRITQGAQPFLLPLMMQLAYGMSATQSGMMTIATALGALTMKGLAGGVLRRFGYRTSLIGVGVLATAGYASCGLFRPDWPMAAVFGVMALSGAMMSLQFTAYNTIAYDEVDAARMSQATAFYTTFQQLTLSAGICIGAGALQLSMAAHARTVPAFADFSAAFWTVAAISLLAIFVNMRFARDAGDGMLGR